MQERTISVIADEILQFRGKCASNIDVATISKKLKNLDDTLTKYKQSQHAIKRDQPKE